ncbi:hydroxycinnamoyl-CoA shikimate/quinate hydroxycinnamoyl transferase [Perilla frutescens var. hirtella]|nr:hydroxycinnamoyl-CoA shikimate/quinate hydroxycinnamoyl transferase [Perilla frutescens var. hirtella]
MKINVKRSTMVRPEAETPSGSLWLSSLDLLMPATHHTRTVYFYRPDGGAANFFDAAAMKAALGRALVDFYPYAGRLRKDDNGRIEINCNAEGVLFVEADCHGAVVDLGGFGPRPDLNLVPKVDYSHGISTFPLFLMQLTRFKCGGVCLGIANEHHISDGISALHFINTLSDISRGHTTAAVPPFFDRRLLAARSPPQPQFPHIEYQPPPSLKTPLQNPETTHSAFSLTPDHLNALKQACNGGAASGNRPDYTTYEAVAGHVWRCACMARRLPRDQETKLQVPVDGRPRLRPPLPPGFFGNGIFYTTAVALCGEMESEPLSFAAGKVHEALARIDDEYMRSALDYLEVEVSDIYAIARSESNVKCPNLGVTSWVRLPLYEADFGWGKPVYAGPAAIQFEGKCLLMVDRENEGGFSLQITLLKPHMELFHSLLYQI